MTVTVMPTLEAMAKVYELPTTGGPKSVRFARYVATMREEGVPAAGYNPMTSKPVGETIERLLELRAERVVHDAAVEAASVLGLDEDLVMFVTVSTPGIWTDRWATEVDHRLAPTNWSGGIGSVLLWTGEEQTHETIRAETLAQVVRVAWIKRHGEAPRTVMDAVAQEGLAYALSGRTGAQSDAVADALDVVGTDETIASKVAVLYGDETAIALGHLPLGLPPMSGYNHAITLAYRSG